MPVQKISDMTAITGSNTATDDVFVVVDTSTNATKKITRAELNNAIEQDVLASIDVTTANIDGGTIDGTTIGASSATTGVFTTVTANTSIIPDVSGGADIGTKAVLVLPPYYFKNVSDEGVITYYRNVIEESGDNNFKFLLYNIPQHSGVTITFSIIENLLKLYPNNVVGLKDSTGDMDGMLKTIKYFNDFAVFCGNGALALHTCRRGGAGAITGDANITAKLLSFIIHNYKDEKEIKNFNDLQLLLEKIRNVLSSHEQISLLKAYYSVADKISEWNNLMPPLKVIENPENNKQVIALLDLVGQIDSLVPSSS